MKCEYQQYEPHVQHSPYAHETRHAVRFLRDMASRLWDFTASYTEGFEMLWTIFIMLLILWFLGLVSSYTLGGYIHILLVVAIIVLVVNLLTGRRGAA